MESKLVDLWLTNCDGFVVDIGSTIRLTTDDDIYNIDRWAEIILKLGDKFSVDLIVNGMMSSSGIFDPMAQAIDHENQIHVGAYNGLLYFMKGIIYSLEYTPFEIFSSARFWMGGHYNNGSLTEMNLCEWDQYFDGFACEPCHETCTHGCSSGDECDECSPFCKTCNSVNSNTCTECW